MTGFGDEERAFTMVNENVVKWKEILFGINVFTIITSADVSVPSRFLISFVLPFYHVFIC